MARKTVATRLAGALRMLAVTVASVAPLASAGCSQTASAGTLSGTRLGAAQLEPSVEQPSPRAPSMSRLPALELLDRHESFAFNRSAAEVVDYHAPTRHVFVVDSGAVKVTVLTLGANGFHGGERALEPGRDIAGFDAKQVTSLAVGGDLLAVAVPAERNDRPGRVAFYSADELRYLGAVTVGFVPDMLTFTPDGQRVLVANEGEQVRDADDRIVADPEGSVSIIDLRAGVAAAQVSHARFARFDARLEEYRRAGVRIARLGDRFFESGAGAVRLSRDLEPEYIAVTADAKSAWVSLQENDAVALLDVESASFVEIFPLGVKDFSLGRPTLESVPLGLPAAPALRRPGEASAVDVRSRAEGLWFDPSESQSGQEVLYLLRGAALERHVLEGGRTTCTALIALELPGAGGRSRGLARDTRDGSFWVGDAARAVLYRLDADGRLQHRLPLPAAAGEGVAALAFDPSGQRALAFLEAPAVGAAAAPAWARLVVIDGDPRRASFGARLAEYLYPLGGAPGEARAHVVAASLVDPERLLVAERGADGRDAVYRIDLAGAGDLRGLERGPAPADDGVLRELLATGALQPVHKRALFGFAHAGAAAGLAVLGGDRFGLLGAPGLELWPGQLTGPERDSEYAAGVALGVVRFDAGKGLDASDRDAAARLGRWPVLGAYMPDGIAALQLGGADYFITANEGDTRGYDARRLRDLELDPARFPDAAGLQSSMRLGRLKVSWLDGDLDGDGDLDEVHAFGARSVSLWDRSGRLVFDTGSLFEDVTATALADAFNSNNDANGSFDSRSDDRGPEPEGLAVAEIGGHSYAFVGLERVGGIVVLDVTDPFDVRFVEYDNLRDFSANAEGGARDLGPEGLKFVPPAASPTGRGLLLVANEVSGTTTAYDINL